MPGTRLPARRALRHPLTALVLAALAPGCSKVEYLPDQPLAGWYPPVVLVHRGGGEDCYPGSPFSCMPNTLPAVLHGLDLPEMGGVEVDVQISQNGTLWLGHDNEVHDCAGNLLPDCFQEMSDGEIDAVAHCDGTAPCTPGSSATCVQTYVRLDEVLAAMSGVHPEKRISLDIKGQYCRELGVGEAQDMADEVDRLVRTHAMGGRVLAETSQLAFLDQLVGRGAPVDTFVVSLGDVDGPLGAASRQGATGISFKFDPASEPMDASVVAGIHQKGFRIILWTVNEDPPGNVAAAWAAAPDVIETDETDFFQLVPGR